MVYGTGLRGSLGKESEDSEVGGVRESLPFWFRKNGVACEFLGGQCSKVRQRFAPVSNAVISWK